MSPHGNDPDHLIQQFQTAGFREAFGILWLHHQLHLKRFIGARYPHDGAEDLLQEVSLKLFRYLSKHVVEVFPASAFKITKDQIVDGFRAHERLPKLETLDDLIALNLEPIVGSPDKRLEQWSRVQHHMDQCGVSRPQQTVVILHHLIGYSVEEVALITETGHETVKSRLRYASAKLGRSQRQRETP